MGQDTKWVGEIYKRIRQESDSHKSKRLWKCVIIDQDDIACDGDTPHSQSIGVGTLWTAVALGWPLG